MDLIETEQTTQNNRLDNLRLDTDLVDVTMNDPITIGQVFAYGGTGWGNYTIDIST